MKRRPLVLSVIAGLLLACQGTSQPQPPPPSPEAAAKAEPAPLRFSPRGEALSGCIHGAPLAKVVIRLARDGGRTCRADVSPALVCVAPGAIIRWRIDNTCGPLRGTDQTPALALKNSRARAFDPKKPFGEPVSLLTHCEPRLDQIKGERSFLYCTVQDDARDGIYKYDIQGAEIDPLDPDIEVRRP